jgi:hypothetical protein
MDVCQVLVESHKKWSHGEKRKVTAWLRLQGPGSHPQTKLTTQNKEIKFGAAGYPALLFILTFLVYTI